MANRTSALDIEVRSINLTTSDGIIQDIKFLINQFKISEALLLPIAYGEAWVLDGINLLDKMGVKGFDHISFAFGNPGQPKVATKTFRVYDIKDRARASNSAQTYRLLFCSEELYLASQYPVVKSFKGQTASQIVKDICVNTLKIPQDKLEIEDSVGQINYMATYMRPFEAIQKVSRHAMTASNHPSFLFYETLLSGFKFKSIETLFKEDTVAEYVYKQTRIDSLAIDPYGVISYTVKKNFDTISDTQSGKYASNMLTFDPIRQVTETIKFDLQEFFDKTVHVQGQGSGSQSKMPLLQNRKGDTANKAIESHARFVPTTLRQPQSEYVKARQPDILPFQTEKTDLARNSFFQNFNDHRVHVTVPGNATLESGMIVNLKILSPEIQGSTSVDEKISGRYIICTLSHTMTQSRKFFTEMSLVRDDSMSSSTPSTEISFGDFF